MDVPKVHKTKEDLYALLIKVTILDEISQIKSIQYERTPIEREKFEEYVAKNTKLGDVHKLSKR